MDFSQPSLDKSNRASFAGLRLRSGERKTATDHSLKSKNPALIAQHSVLLRCFTLRFSLLTLYYFAVLLFALRLEAAAQQKPKTFHIGYIAAAPGPSPFFEAFRERLRELGYLEGGNIVIEYRSSEDRNRAELLATEMARLGLDGKDVIAAGARVREQERDSAQRSLAPKALIQNG